MQLSLNPTEIVALAAAIAQQLQINFSPGPAPETKLLTVAEVAKNLRKSEKTVREYIATGALPAINANRGTNMRASYTVLETDVQAYIKRRRA